MTSRAWAGDPSPVEDELPPLAPPNAGADERARAVMARMLARFGPPSIEDYRRTYRIAGIEWPGDDEIRRRHATAEDADPSTGSGA